MIVPQNITQNLKVAIVSPAGFVDENFVYSAKKYFDNIGFEAEIFPSCLKKFHRYAGTDAERLKDLQTALDDASYGAILCSRGGYGTLRIIDKIDFSKFLKNPKWLIGFSDITILHSAINKHGVASIHGPMSKAFFEEPKSESVKNLINILKGQFPDYKLSKHSLNKNGSATGKLIGGNLSTIFSLQGTPYEINTDGKILFIEDVNEYLYHLDRIMLSLKHSGKLKNLKALIAGAFTDMIDSEPSFGKSAYEIVNEHIAEYDYPVCFNFPGGHINNNMPLIMGIKYEIGISKSEVVLKHKNNF